MLYRQVDQFVADCRSVQQGYMMYKRKREAAVSTYLCGGGWVGRPGLIVGWSVCPEGGDVDQVCVELLSRL